MCRIVEHHATPTVNASGKTDAASTMVTGTLTLGGQPVGVKIVQSLNHNWSVDLGAKPSGTYHLTATAPPEASDSVDITVP